MTDSRTSPTDLFAVLTEIGIINQLSTTAFERLLPDDMRLSHFTLLHHLARLDGKWSPARLANALQVTKGAITNTMQRMEKKGYVLVEPAPGDGRGKLVSLTPAGLARRDEALMMAAPALAPIAAQCTPDEIAAALPFLTNLRTAFDKARD